MTREGGVPTRIRGSVGLLRGGVLLLAALSALPGCDAPAEAPAEEIPVGTEEGMRAPPLPGNLASGDVFELEPRPAAPTVLIFYRSATCGLCRLQLEQTQRNIGAYAAQGARVIAVTLDPPDLSSAFAREAGLTYAIVSVNPDVFRLWGAMDPERGAPLPATFIVDQDGLIRFRHIGRNAADRTTDAGVVTVLQRMARQ